LCLILSSIPLSFSKALFLGLAAPIDSTLNLVSSFLVHRMGLFFVVLLD
jgi:hypothetical protein